MKFPGRYESLAEIAKFVRQAAEKAGLSKFAAYTVETAVDEACANIIEHAYGGEGLGEIECICKVSEKGLVIILKDQGRPFDPNKIPHPNTKAPLYERADRGLGLYFIHKWMDEVRFEFIPGAGNILTMVKFKEQKA